MTEEEKKEFEEFLQWKAEKAKSESSVEQREEEPVVESREENKLESPQEIVNPSTPPPIENDNEGSKYKMVLIILAGFLLLYFIVAKCHSSSSSPQPAVEEEYVVDSIAEVVEESKPTVYVAHTINKDSIINTMKADFTFKKDEFSTSDGCWVEPKSRPRYRNTNAFYCYFWLSSNNLPSNMRFVMQYEDDDWLFIKNCVFNVDGENITYVPDKMEHDNHSRIWEWFDDQVDSDNIYLIRKIANAKTVKVKLNGTQYYDTRTIKAKEIASIKKTLEKYEELEGSFR